MTWQIYFILKWWRDSVAYSYSQMTWAFNYHLYLGKIRHYFLSLLSQEAEYGFAPGKVSRDIFSTLFIIWEWPSIAAFIFYFYNGRDETYWIMISERCNPLSGSSLVSDECLLSKKRKIPSLLSSPFSGTVSLISGYCKVDFPNSLQLVFFLRILFAYWRTGNFCHYLSSYFSGKIKCFTVFWGLATRPAGFRKKNLTNLVNA